MKKPAIACGFFHIFRCGVVGIVYHRATREIRKEFRLAVAVIFKSRMLTDTYVVVGKVCENAGREFYSVDTVHKYRL